MTKLDSPSCAPLLLPETPYGIKGLARVSSWQDHEAIDDGFARSGTLGRLLRGLELTDEKPVRLSALSGLPDGRSIIQAHAGRILYAPRLRIGTARVEVQAWVADEAPAFATIQGIWRSDHHIDSLREPMEHLMDELSDILQVQAIPYGTVLFRADSKYFL